MQIQYYEEPDLAESRVEVFYREYNEEIESLAAYLEKEQVLVCVFRDGGKQNETTRNQEINRNGMYYMGTDCFWRSWAANAFGICYWAGNLRCGNGKL